MVWLPDNETFDDMFNHLDRIPACDGQTDGQTDGHLATAQSALCIASCLYCVESYVSISQSII